MARPVPIPNTAVKRPIADGSGCIASARVGRRQIKIKAETVKAASAFCFLKAELAVDECPGKSLNSGRELEFGHSAVAKRPAA